MRLPARFGPFVGALPALGVLGAGCTDSQKPTVAGNNIAQLDVAGFPPFAQSEGSFELWISFDGASPADVSLGKFHINETRQIVSTDWQPTSFAFVEGAGVPTDDDGSIAWSLATAAFVTLEPRDDPDPAPAMPALLSGPFTSGVAHLDVTGERALGVSLSSISGAFHLATPTTSTTDDELDGIWFATVGGGAAALALPDLPPGWVYEGWHSLLFADTQSLGQFSTVNGPDASGAGPPGDSPGYPFPGEDFPWGPGVDLRDGNVLVSIEPEDGRDGPGPLPMMNLLGGPVPATAATMQALVNVAELPTASVSVPFSP